MTMCINWAHLRDILIIIWIIISGLSLGYVYLKSSFSTEDRNTWFALPIILDAIAFIVTIIYQLYIYVFTEC